MISVQTRIGNILTLGGIVVFLAAHFFTQPTRSLVSGSAFAILAYAAFLSWRHLLRQGAKARARYSLFYLALLAAVAVFHFLWAVFH